MASISVVIPAYNAQDTIVEALRSVLRQSVAVEQIIVVDDGSTDGTAQLVREQFPQVLVEQISNGGPSRARNHGLQLATGAWIAFLDADDRWHPNKMAAQMDVVEDGVELLASDWVRGERFAPVPHPPPKSHLTYRDLLSLNQFQTSTVLMTRRLALALGGFDSAVDGAEDWDFWLRAARETSIVKVDWPLVQYRDVPTGYSKDVWRVYATMQPMLDKHRDNALISHRDFSTLEEWHHLRFGVAFILAHDSGHAKKAWRNAVRRSLLPYLPRAFFGYLLPFLMRRVRQRTHA